jgi:hypothetical protein
MRSNNLKRHRKSINNRSIRSKNKSLAQKTKRRNNRIKKTRRTRNARGGGKPELTTPRMPFTTKANLNRIGKIPLPPLVIDHQSLLKSFKYLSNQINKLTQNVYEKSSEVGNILIPDDIKPIGYAFSENCDEYYYIVLGYYFVRNANDEFELAGYLAMQPRLIATGAMGTEITKLGVNSVKECNFIKPITRSQYEKVNNDLALRINALTSIIEDRELYHSLDGSYFRIGYIPKQP